MPARTSRWAGSSPSAPRPARKSRKATRSPANYHDNPRRLRLSRDPHMAKKDKDDIEQDDQETSVAVNDAWTGMLAISLLALMIGTGLLAWDYMSYPSEDPPKTPKIASASPDGPA